MIACSDKIRVLIVDDSAIVRALLRSLLEDDSQAKRRVIADGGGRRIYENPPVESGRAIEPSVNSKAKPRDPVGPTWSR